MVNEAIIEPRDDELDSFWVRARTRGKVYPLEAIAGQEAVATLCPPAFALGDTKEMANKLAALVVEGKKTATSSWQASYELAGEELPRVGELGIVCDGEGLPQALVRITKVELIPFQEIGSDVAQAEGEGDLSSWVEAHRDFFMRELKDIRQFVLDGQLGNEEVFPEKEVRSDTPQGLLHEGADAEEVSDEFDPAGNVVVEYFEVVYSREV